jgi:integrating conjugative element protein (TIGR03765 family)
MKHLPLIMSVIVLWTALVHAKKPVAGSQVGAVVHPVSMSTHTPMDDAPQADRSLPTVLSEVADVAWVLPISSRQLSPGLVAPRALNMPGLQPFFLVGDDPQSLVWLRQHAVKLQALKAAGLAVEVADAHALARIRAAAPGIAIVPVNGNDIATRLQIEHYPVLITATALEQ